MFWIFISVGIIIAAIIWATFIVINELQKTMHEIQKVKDDIVFHDAVYNSVFENIADGVDINTNKEEKIKDKIRWRFGNEEIQKRMNEYFSK